VRILYVVLLAAGLAASATGATRQTPRDDSLFQASTLGALQVGVLDGDMTFARLRRNGDFGLGTFNALDGEMVAVDGSFYQVRVDGSVHRVPNNAKTPFAVVKWFRPNRTLTLSGVGSLEALGQLLDAEIASPNIPTAIRIQGRFPRLTTRSVPRQSKPYPTLAEAVQQQTTFQLTDVEGVMVGFRTPAYLGAVNVSGYHFHFLTADRRAGGHVLAAEIGQARAQLDNALGVRMVLPGTPEFADALLPAPSP